MTDTAIADLAEDILRFEAIGGDLMAFAIYYLGRDPWGLREEIYDFIADSRRSIITVPMGHGKSTTITETLPIALAAWNRDIRIIVGSEATSRAVEAVRFCRTQLEYNPRILEDFGSFKSQPWQEGKFAVSGRSALVSHPTVQAIGMDSAVLGGRADVVILDDIVSRRNSQTAHQQRKTTEWVDTTIQSRLDPPGDKPWPYGAMWVVGNLFHPQDTIARLSERGTFDVFLRAAFTDADRTEVLLPEFWTKADLDQRRLEVGPTSFELSYMNNPGGMADSPFRPEWLRYWTTDAGRAMGDVELIPPRGNLRVYQGWDLASTRSETSDYSVCATAALHPMSGRIFWLDVWRGRVEPWQLVEQIAAQAKLHRPQRIAIEANGFQLLAAQAVMKDYPELMPLIWPTRTPSDRSKVDRIISGLQPSFARQAHHFQEGLAERDPDILTEIMHFPGSRHDDVPDAMEIALRDLDKGIPMQQSPVGLFVGPVH